MTDAIREEFIKLVGERPTRDAYQAAAWDIKLEGFRLPRSNVPAGWCLAPVEPTKAMLDAAEKLDWTHEDIRGNCCNQWNVMLAAITNVEGVPAGEADRLDAERWHAVEELMIAGSLVEIEQDEDGGWTVTMEGVECAGQVWKGGTPQEVIDKVVAQLAPAIAQQKETEA